MKIEISMTFVENSKNGNLTMKFRKTQLDKGHNLFAATCILSFKQV